MKKILKLFPSEKDFASFYEKEKWRIKQSLGSAVLIEHVGSTSVPSLGGKGIIDIAIGVPKLSDLRPTADKLIDIGYFADLDNAMPSDRIFLASREHDSTLGDYHVHIVVKYGDEWIKLLFFRDKLRSDESLRKEYEALKEKLLAATNADRRKYKKLKNDFIQKVLENLDDDWLAD